MQVKHKETSKLYVIVKSKDNRIKLGETWHNIVTYTDNQVGENNTERRYSRLEKEFWEKFELTKGR
jgi:hypothetical protein